MKLQRVVCLFLLVGFFLAHGVLGAEEWTAVCVEIVDGDTIIVERDGARVALRLGGIDAPEMGQPFGPEAKDHLGQLALGQSVTIVPLGGLERETPAVVRVGELDLRQELLTAGLAWHDTENNDEEELVLAMFIARSSAKGLWSETDPVPPAEWRKLNEPPDRPQEAKRETNRLSSFAGDVSINREIEDRDGVIRIDRGSSSEDDSGSAMDGKHDSDGSGDSCLGKVESRAPDYAEKKGCTSVYGVNSATKVRGTTYKVQGSCLDSETGRTRTFEILFICSTKNLPGQVLVSGSDKPIKKSSESTPVGFKFIN